MSATSYVTSTLCRVDAVSMPSTTNCGVCTSDVVISLSSPTCQTTLNAGKGFLLVRSINDVPRGSRVSIPLGCTSCCCLRTLGHGQSVRGNLWLVDVRCTWVSVSLVVFLFCVVFVALLVHTCQSQRKRFPSSGPCCLLVSVLLNKTYVNRISSLTLPIRVGIKRMQCCEGS